MNIIVAGGRDFTDYNLMKDRLDFYFKDIKPTIICGEARGADSLGKKYAQEHGLEVISMPADWEKHGKAAGMIRNVAMSRIADGLVAFHDSKSKGTAHMIQTMRNRGKPVRIVYYNLEV